MNKSDRELIDEMFRGVRAEIKAKDDLIMLRLNQILNQGDSASTRIAALENQTSIIRWFERNPKRFMALGIILFFLASVGGKEIVEAIIDKMI